MSLVFAGVCSHAPGITGRAHLADAAVKDEFHAQFHRFGEAMREGVRKYGPVRAGIYAMTTGTDEKVAGV